MENNNQLLEEANLERNQKKAAEEKLLHFMEQIKMDQNLPMAFIGGLLAAVIGGMAWAAITVATDYQIGYMAVAVGLLVGYTTRLFGKGVDQIFGILGAALALLGCILGNFMTIIWLVANEQGLSIVETLTLIDFTLIPEIMSSSFSPIDLIFYGIALYEGYKFSFRQLSEVEIYENITSK
ncbi:hypothetical protein [Flammeovirga kamogawensis]|uniref:Uncharacterized protein n=1 Tax=Flammeovirga kamogawensis TaxID=373891 RepID=A0ABX8H2M2_9BACT|nr:hypothetical protein [Flammeovirga kamogawensis]MBB6464064.1 hypothetical protein [Flammeovirga kamogawensis]QWG09878.1 hypothetical protein KM029_19550 [Flammeovirga kamogawensis]